MSAHPSACPTPEQLIEHSRFVRALARALVDDPMLADDLAQEAMLDAIRRPPRLTVGLRAWFRGVVRNKVRQHFRGETRRVRREKQAAFDRSARAESPAVWAGEVLHRAEQRQQIGEAVLSLKEPYRLAIVLRYMEDMTPLQISEVTETPINTVKTRLQRGLSQLREHFDRSYGDRRSWQLAFVTLIQGPGSAPAVSAEPLTASVAATPTSISWGILAAVFLVALATLSTRTFWGEHRVSRSGGEVAMDRALSSHADSDRDTILADNLVSGAHTPTADSAIASGPTSPRSATEDARNNATLNEGVSAPTAAALVRVRVVNIAGEPIAGATFKAQRSSPEVAIDVTRSPEFPEAFEMVALDVEGHEGTTPTTDARGEALLPIDTTPALWVSHPNYVSRQLTLPAELVVSAAIPPRERAEPRTPEVVEVTLIEGDLHRIQIWDVARGAALTDATVRLCLFPEQPQDSLPIVPLQIDVDVDADGIAAVRYEGGYSIMATHEEMMPATLVCIDGHAQGNIGESPRNDIDYQLLMYPGARLRVVRGKHSPQGAIAVHVLDLAGELLVADEVTLTGLAAGTHIVVGYASELDSRAQFAQRDLPPCRPRQVTESWLRERAGQVFVATVDLASGETTTLPLFGDIEREHLEVVGEGGIELDVSVSAAVGNEVYWLQREGIEFPVAVGYETPRGARFEQLTPGDYSLWSFSSSQREMIASLHVAAHPALQSVSVDRRSTLLSVDYDLDLCCPRVLLLSLDDNRIAHQQDPPQGRKPADGASADGASFGGVPPGRYEVWLTNHDRTWRREFRINGEVRQFTVTLGRDLPQHRVAVRVFDAVGQRVYLPVLAIPWLGENPGRESVGVLESFGGFEAWARAQRLHLIASSDPRRESEKRDASLDLAPGQYEVLVPFVDGVLRYDLDLSAAQTLDLHLPERHAVVLRCWDGGVRRTWGQLQIESCDPRWQAPPWLCSLQSGVVSRLDAPGAAAGSGGAAGEESAQSRAARARSATDVGVEGAPATAAPGEIPLDLLEGGYRARIPGGRWVEFRVGAASPWIDLDLSAAAEPR